MSSTSVNYAWFYIGTGALALVVGMLIGVSASPVVAIAMPLLFALLSAGGGFYVILGKDDEGPISSRSRANRAGFMGKQLAVFGLGVVLGVWCGAWAKLHSDTLWAGNSRPKSAISGIPFTEPDTLAGLLELDRRLQQASVSLLDRKSILERLHAAMVKRRESGSPTTEDDSKALEKLIEQWKDSKEGIPGAVAIEPTIEDERRRNTT